MNNTRTTLTALVAVFLAVTLVVGTLTVTQSASAAYGDTKKVRPQQQDDNNGNSKNGNTITIQKCKQAAIQSGWDNDQEQECANLICTHPGENAICTQEGAVAAATATPTATPPTTGTLRVIKTVTCRSTDPNCSLPAVCQINIGSESSTPPTQELTCQDAFGNGVLVTLNPGLFSVSITEIGGPPTFAAFKSFLMSL